MRFDKLSITCWEKLPGNDLITLRKRDYYAIDNLILEKPRKMKNKYKFRITKYDNLSGHFDRLRLLSVIEN